MKIVTKILNGALSLFESLVIPRIKLEWLSNLTALLINRLKVVNEVLTDDNLNNSDQLSEVARKTLLTPQFLFLQNDLLNTLAARIDEPVVNQLFTGTEKLRTDLFLALGDDVVNDKEQIKAVLSTFVKTEEFDGLAIALVTLLAEKYSNNELVKEFIIKAVENLVNSDDVKP